MEHPDVYQIDTSIITVLPFGNIQNWFFKNNKQTDLKFEDFQKLEAILNRCINDYNTEQEKQFEEINRKHPEYELDKKNFIIDVKRYKRQYVAIINSRGEKEVFVNCFCATQDRNWKKNLIIARDGGNCYFNLKINLTKGEYYELMVNGVA